MKKFVVQAVLLLIVIGGGIVFFGPKSDTSKIDLPFLPQQPKFENLQISDSILKVEIADTPAKQRLGLGGRDSLGENEGMLFIFGSKDIRAFWMKGLKFSLDLIWISDNKIVDFTENVPPPVKGQSDISLPTFASKEPVDKVLELNGGSVKKLNIKVGDTIKTTP